MPITNRGTPRKIVGWTSRSVCSKDPYIKIVYTMLPKAEILTFKASGCANQHDAAIDIVK